MFKFSEKSRKNLNTCNEDLQIIASYAIKVFDFAVIEGYRNKEDQNKFFNEGKSKVKYPDSKHNNNCFDIFKYKEEPCSLAFDILPFLDGKPISWNDKDQWIYFSGIMMGISEALYEQGVISHKLRWGGDWDRDGNLKNNNFNDLVHFELENE